MIRKVEDLIVASLADSTAVQGTDAGKLELEGEWHRFAARDIIRILEEHGIRLPVEIPTNSEQNP